MAYRRLSKSISLAIKAHNALSRRPSLLFRSRALSASAHHFSSSSFLLRPSSFIGAPNNGIITPATLAAPRSGQLLPLSLQLQLPSPRRFMSTVRGRLHVDLFQCQCFDFNLLIRWSLVLSFVKDGDKDAHEKYENALEKCGTDLTEMARQGKLPPLIGRDDEIKRCIQILGRMTKSNPLIIGEPGVGKTAIAEG